MENLWEYSYLGIAASALFFGSLFIKHLFQLYSKKANYTKKQIVRKKRLADFYLLLSCGIFEISEIFLFPAEWGPATFSNILETTVLVLFKTCAMSFFYGIPIKIQLKLRDLEEAEMRKAAAEPPPPAS